MAERLEGTVALVTGASSGIGEATAKLLAKLGASVSVVARRGDRLRSLASAIEGDGGRVLVIESDIAVREQAAAAVERTVTELGRLDILVNNAGVMLLGPIAEAPLEEWERMVSSTPWACSTAARQRSRIYSRLRRAGRGVSPISSTSARSRGARRTRGRGSTT